MFEKLFFSTTRKPFFRTSKAEPAVAGGPDGHLNGESPSARRVLPGGFPTTSYPEQPTSIIKEAR